MSSSSLHLFHFTLKLTFLKKKTFFATSWKKSLCLLSLLSQQSINRMGGEVTFCIWSHLASPGLQLSLPDNPEFSYCWSNGHRPHLSYSISSAPDIFIPVLEVLYSFGFHDSMLPDYLAFSDYSISFSRSFFCRILNTIDPNISLWGSSPSLNLDNTINTVFNYLPHINNS